MNSIVIATDGSSGARDALEQGYELAAQLEADVSVVYVRHAPAPFLGAPYYQDVLTDEAEHARGVIAEAKLCATRYAVDPDYEVLEGDPAEAVVAFAQARDADLIVVGSSAVTSASAESWARSWALSRVRSFGAPTGRSWSRRRASGSPLGS